MAFAATSGYNPDVFGDSAMRLFDLPPGQRTEIITTSVGVLDSTRGLTLERRIRCQVTATDEFERCEDGVLRRRFRDATPPLSDHTDDVWLADAPLDPSDWMNA